MSPQASRGWLLVLYVLSVAAIIYGVMGLLT